MMELKGKNDDDDDESVHSMSAARSILKSR